MADKQAALPLELDFLFGRPLLRTVVMYGLDARPAPDGGIMLVQTTKAACRSAVHPDTPAAPSFRRAKEIAMYIVTGGAGMIGSAVVWELNRRGVDDILIVDNLASTDKWKNLVHLQLYGLHSPRRLHRGLRRTMARRRGGRHPHGRLLLHHGAGRRLSDGQ